ncbi:hypothetical protein [Xanthomonas massiliensis]|uniref:hypothetical protein n=1 Tax=Xanthomonas massiliensis TaxID=1720302 RepID=UPI000ACB323B|nr:hypothetical protein [Xanthomonas massiliensis]
MKTTTRNVLAFAVLAVLGGNGLAQEKDTSGRGSRAPADASDEDLFKPLDYKGPPLPAPRLADGHPDLSGYWQGQRDKSKPGGNFGKDYPGFILPYSELGKRALLYSQNHTPDPEAICTPGGIPRHDASGLPFEILATPERFVTFYHYTTHRTAVVGPKRALPANPAPSYFGTNVAYWDGDTLVVQTEGLRDSSIDRIWLDENGNPTSGTTTVVERWSRPDYHHLNVQVTVTDPKYYREPIHFDRTWNFGGDDRGLGEYSCNENNIDAEAIGPGAGVIGPDGNRGYGNDKPLPKEPPGPEAYDL